MKIGTRTGMLRSATILRFNKNGTVRIGLDEAGGYGAPNEFTAPIPAAWMGPSGEFIGGCPTVGATVVVTQGQGGQWYVVSYLNSNDVFSGQFVSAGKSLMSALKPGRALMQTSKGNRIFADPDIGMQLGNAKEFVHIDPARGMFSHNIDSQLSFTEAQREINHVVKRDLSDNLNRNVIGSTLTSQSYDSQLKPICLDPLTALSRTTLFPFVRNPPFVESREVVYEFADSFGFTTEDDEAAKTANPADAKPQPDVNRRKMRADAFSLSLEHPNHLIETVKGTAVDLFGNILNLNRDVIPIGAIDKTSLLRSADKAGAFAQIRALERRSIAFHWELNARKGEEKTDEEQLADITALPPPMPSDTTNYGRSRSRFFLDIDKEGQFKLNVPSSSEIGNIPLLTRYENYSVVLARGMSAEGQDRDPNEFIRNQARKEIFANDFTAASTIKLSSGDADLDGTESPIDWLTDEPIKFGTAHHDMTGVLKDFTEAANWTFARDTLINDPIHPLNETVEQFEKIVADTITVSGPDADGGGRSGMINLDGWVGVSVGANTIDRQSIWLDTAGGVIHRLGRDRQNISYGATMDGDVFMEIGGPGIGNEHDSRFKNANDAFRGGTLDIRVINDAGMSALIRIDPTGMHLSTPGRLTLWAEQDIIMKSVRGDIKMEAENIVAYSETSKKRLGRNPANQEIV